MNYRQIYSARVNAVLQHKRAAAILTPEAEQAAMQQAGAMPPQGGAPMDPSMMGGAPMDPAMMGGAPMDPSMMGGMPPQGGAPMDPSMMGGMPPQGGVPMDPSMMGGMPPQDMPLPPEILQDQMFMQFLADSFGIMLDPSSGMFMDQQGQVIPPDMIMQAYQAFQQQMMAQQGAPGMAGGPMGQEGAPGMPAGADMQVDQSTEMMNAVMDGVSTVLQEYNAAIEKKMSTILDKIDSLVMAVEALQNTTDKRTEAGIEDEQKLRDELAAELNTTQVPDAQPQQQARPTQIQGMPIDMLSVIQGRG